MGVYIVTAVLVLVIALLAADWIRAGRLKKAMGHLGPAPRRMRRGQAIGATVNPDVTQTESNGVRNGTAGIYGSVAT